VRESQLQPGVEIVAETGGGNTVGSDSTGSAGVLEFRDGERFDTFERDRAVVAFELTQPVADVVAQDGVGAECVEVHVTAHAD